MAALSTVLAVALIWYVWWLAIVSFRALLATAIGHTFNYDREYYVTAEEVAKLESRRMTERV